MANSWLLLLFSLPTNRNTERVAVWRRLKKMGAVQIKTSTYLLPDEPAQHEQFQWLAQQIRDYGGDSTLVRAQEIEGLTKEKVIAMFNDARAKDYGELRKSLQGFITRRKKMDAEESAPELEQAHASVSGNSRNRFFRQRTRARYSDAPSASGRTEAVAATGNIGRKTVSGENMADAPTSGDRPRGIRVADLEVYRSQT